MKIYAVKIMNMSQNEFNMLRLLINIKKRNEIERFISKEDKIRGLIKEIFIRTIITRELGITNECITFEKNRYGKPFIKACKNFEFNLSHSGQFVVCAVDEKPIGIDIEEIKDIEYKEIAENYFTSIEYNYIVNNELSIRLSKFYEIWTLKESYIKCFGQGLSIPLRSFSIEIDSNGNVEVISCDECNEYNEYTFRRFDIQPGYKMAVCSLSKHIPNEIINIDQNILISNYIKWIT